MKRVLLLFAIAGFLVFGTVCESWAQEFPQVGTEEEILFMDIPVVFASSKREQLLTEAASSVKVVTSEDIKRSGATNLGDVLRSVAGVDVREPHAGQHVIGIRGFCDTAHVLVTISSFRLGSCIIVTFANTVLTYRRQYVFYEFI